jgi:hypothetical protein
MPAVSSFEYRRVIDLEWAREILSEVSASSQRLMRTNPFLCLTRDGGRGRDAFGGYGFHPTEQEAMEAASGASLVLLVRFDLTGEASGFDVVKERCSYPEYLRMMRARKKGRNRGIGRAESSDPRARRDRKRSNFHVSGNILHRIVGMKSEEH